jgi:hypothetical protein
VVVRGCILSLVAVMLMPALLSFATLHFLKALTDAP